MSTTASVARTLVLLGLVGALRAETVAVDATAAVHAIDPRIYGVAFATTAQLTALHAPLDRYGGDTTSTYNYQQNVSNHASDYYFESIPDGPATPGELIDDFVTANQAGSADSVVTIPLLAYVARTDAARDYLWSFSQAKYGAQTADDPYRTDAGNGVLAATNDDVVGNDPLDAYVASNVTFQQGLLSHLVATHGAASAGGVRYYGLDNESSIWFQVHRDVHPAGATMDEISTTMIAYATMIKAADPSATVMAPEEWGWDGFLYSGADQQASALNGYTSYPDQAAHGGVEYVAYLLSQFQAASTSAGKRLVDVFSLHWYPQGGEFSDATDTATELLRNQSTRSLWDPTYVDQSWINTEVDLIPRMQAWVAANDPGLEIGLTEYNWGAEASMNGATAQADVLGILGRQGVNLATRWTTPVTGSPVFDAMLLYRNYDGAGSAFGDSSVAATVANPDNLAAFAAVRSVDGALTVMLVHKELTASDAVTLTLADFSAGANAQVWQLASTAGISQLASVPVLAHAVALTLPPQSITLVVVPPSSSVTTATTTGTGTTATGTGTTTTTGTGTTSTTTSTTTTGTTTGTSTSSSTSSSTTTASATASVTSASTGAASSGGGGGGGCGVGGAMGALSLALVVRWRRRQS